MGGWSRGRREALNPFLAADSVLAQAGGSAKPQVCPRSLSGGSSQGGEGAPTPDSASPGPGRPLILDELSFLVELKAGGQPGGG